MPVPRLTNIKPAFPLLGRLRKGAKKTDPKKPGKDLTFFRFTSERPEVVEAFYKAYSEEPTNINVYMPYPNALVTVQNGEGAFDVWQEKWNASNTLLHRCDGEFVVRYFDANTGKHIDPQPGIMPCPGGCEEVGRLFVIIPELLEAGLVGDVMLRSGSQHDIISILGSLQEAERERKGHPHGIMGIEFRLERLDEFVSSPAWKDEPVGKRHRVEKSLVKLTPSAKWVMARLESQKRTALLLAPETTSDPEATLQRNRERMHGGGDVIEGEAVVIEDTPETGAFPSIAAAVDWAFGTGYYESKTDAGAGYAECKKIHKATNAEEMGNNFRQYVKHLIMVRKAENHPCGPDSLLGELTDEELSKELNKCDGKNDAGSVELSGYIVVLLEERRLQEEEKE